MSTNEQRSVEQVRRLLGALGFGDARVRHDSPPRPDVFAEVDGRRIAIEATDFHGDETIRGGSAIRRDEQRDAGAGRMRTYAVPAEPYMGWSAAFMRKRPSTTNSPEPTKPGLQSLRECRKQGPRQRPSWSRPS